MSDVFVSYSRGDSAFVARLTEALQARGKQAWVDVSGIRDGEVFPAALRSAIEGSDGFAFVISPGSVASAYCEQEIAHAVELNKRVVPLLLHHVPESGIPDAVRERQWIPFENGERFDDGVRRLVEALDTDLEWTRAHTRWLVKAIEWDREGRERSLLLRGAELAGAERWLAGAEGKHPEPTTLQREYVHRSRVAAGRRLRALVAAMAVALAAAIALGVVALTQRNEARDQSAIARSRELAALSAGQVAAAPDLAVLLGREAVRANATPQALFALRQALDGSALRLTLRHPRLVRGAIFSPDGRLVVTCDQDGPITLWDARSGALVRRIKVPWPPNRASFSPDGRSLFVAGDSGGTTVYAMPSGRRVRSFQTRDHLDEESFSADGRLLVTGGDRALKVFDARSLALRRSFDETDLVFDARIVDHDRLVADTTVQGLKIWDVRTGRLLHFLPVAGGAGGLAVTAEGLAFGGAHRIQLMDPASARIVRTVARVPNADVISLALSRDGQRLAVGANDGVARIYDLRSGRELVHLTGHRCCVNSVAFSPDGTRLASSSKDGTVKVWSTQGEAVASTHAPVGAVTGLAYLPGGRLLIAGRGGPAATWTIGGARAPEPIARAGPARALAASADGRTAALAGTDGVTRVLDVGSRRVTAAVRIGAPPRAVALDKDGRTLAIGSYLGSTLYAASTGHHLYDLDAGATVLAVAFAPDRRVLAEASVDQNSDSTLSLKPLPQVSDMMTFREPNPMRVIVFSPDGRLLVGATDADKTIKVWDLTARREVRQLFGHTGTVTSAAFSPDGSLLATAGRDRTVRVWDPRRGVELRAIGDPADVTAVAFSPDGRRFATGDAAGEVRVWDACPGCRDARVLLALAARRATRDFTPIERRTFLSGG